MYEITEAYEGYRSVTIILERKPEDFDKMMLKHNAIMPMTAGNHLGIMPELDGNRIVAQIGVSEHRSLEQIEALAKEIYLQYTDQINHLHFMYNAYKAFRSIVR
jgi:hypothetical protein